MKQWVKRTWHDSRILDVDGNFVCTAASPEAAARLVSEHNMLIECAEALEALVRHGELLGGWESNCWADAEATLAKLKGEA